MEITFLRENGTKNIARSFQKEDIIIMRITKLKKIKMKNKIFLSLFFLSFLVPGCNKSYVYVQKSVNLDTGKKGVSIVSLNPSYVLYSEKKSNKKTYETIAKREEKFNALLSASASQVGVDLKIIDTDHLTENDVFYFERIAQLERNIFTSYFTQ